MTIGQNDNLNIDGVNAKDALHNPEYNFRRIQVKGILDHGNEIRVKRERDGLKGFDVVTPLITHVNDKNEQCGILVNRGWMVADFDRAHKHNMNDSVVTVEGILSAGDNHQKYDNHENAPIRGIFRKIFPEHMATISSLRNTEFVGSVILKQVDFEADNRQAQPDCPFVDDLKKFEIPVETHQGYAAFWKTTTYLTLFANTAFWLAFLSLIHI